MKTIVFLLTAIISLGMLLQGCEKEKDIIEPNQKVNIKNIDNIKNKAMQVYRVANCTVTSGPNEGGTGVTCRNSMSGTCNGPKSGCDTSDGINNKIQTFFETEAEYTSWISGETEIDKNFVYSHWDLYLYLHSVDITMHPEDIIAFNEW